MPRPVYWCTIQFLALDEPMWTQYALTKFAAVVTESVTLICDVTAHPDVDAYWRKDDEVLSTFNAVTLTYSLFCVVLEKVTL